VYNTPGDLDEYNLRGLACTKPPGAYMYQASGIQRYSTSTHALTFTFTSKDAPCAMTWVGGFREAFTIIKMFTHVALFLTLFDPVLVSFDSILIP
jgi:hypothetical protein